MAIQTSRLHPTASHKPHFIDLFAASTQMDLVTLTAAELDQYAADLWLMAPPCQPFTRQGKQLGGSDARSSSFIHLLGQLQLMQQPPQHLLLENVVGFQHSDVHAEMVAALTRCAYNTQVGGAGATWGSPVAWLTSIMAAWFQQNSVQT